MNSATDNEERIRDEMIDEALTLLSIIDAAQADEDISETPAAREIRLLLQAKARRLVAKMIAELRNPANGSTPRPFSAAVA